MAPEPLSGQRPLSKSQLAYHWIRERITRNEYTAGYRLVLATIAKELDMSVVPVREAIRQLEAGGFVTYEHNVGAQVAMIDELQYRDSMVALSVLEGAATALAARRLSPSDLRRARSINEQMVATLENFDPLQFTALNMQFHSALFTKCSNARMVDLVEAEWARMGRLRSSTFSFVPGRAHESVCEHDNIVVLIETGAPLGEIEDAARRHRTATLEAYLAHVHHEDTFGLPA